MRNLPIVPAASHKRHVRAGRANEHFGTKIGLCGTKMETKVFYIFHEQLRGLDVFKIFCAIAIGATMMTTGANANPFTVTSADGKDGRIAIEHFTNLFGCPGHNISPEISWSGAPVGTKSFVVTIFDQDAPTGSGWWHWVVADIPADASHLERGASGNPKKIPTGALEMNSDIGQTGYGGPCPPIGETHRYSITVKALSVEKLDLPETASGALVGLLSNMHSIGQASLVLTGAR
jgi:Raf kinase inhibitor-like YbhB/YbcL family protein